MTIRAALEAAGMLPLAETICRHYGVALERALVDPHCGTRGRKARQVMYATLYTMGWSQRRIALVFGCEDKTVGTALDTVHMSEVRRFVPRRQS